MPTPPKCTCGVCNTCYQRAWRAKNPDKVKATKDRWGRTRNRAGNQAMQEYNREYYRRNHDRILERARERHRADPRRVAARNAVNDAIRAGKMNRDPCTVCGTSVRVQAHHDDYDKPLDVVWLCSKHHADRHRVDPEEGTTV